jgi:hypothetical protein
MSVAYLVFLFTGKILIYFGMEFARNNEISNKFIKKLLSCDLCWGFWIYSLWSFLTGGVLFRDIYYVPVFSQFITGGISSFLVHLVSLGWKSKFEVLVIE